MEYVGRKQKERHSWKCPWEGCNSGEEIDVSFFGARIELMVHIFIEHGKVSRPPGVEFDQCIKPVDVL